MQVLPDLALHGQVPLVGTRHLVAIKRPVIGTVMSVIKSPIDKRRRRKRLGDAILQQECWLRAAQSAVESNGLVKPVSGDSAVPSGLEVLHHEDSKSPADDGFIV